MFGGPCRESYGRPRPRLATYVCEGPERGVGNTLIL